MEPPTTQAPTPPPPPPSQTPNTYHCLCTHLLLATTYTLSSLPRRKAPGLDSAIILPLPPPPSTSISSPTSSRHASPSPSRSRSRSPSASWSSSSAPTAHAHANANDPPSAVEQRQPSTHRPPLAPQRVRRPEKKNRDAEGGRGRGYSILLSATLDRKAVVVRREDGFEKRYLWRCGRCRLVVGYQVDEVHFRGREKDGGSVKCDGASGRRAEVVYLLPGGLLSTEEMKVGGTAVGDEGWV